MTAIISRNVVVTGFVKSLSICAIVLLAACARDPDLIGIDNPEIPVASVATATKHKIFLASTRQPTETAGVFFSEDRAPSLGLASVQVSIPPTHIVGELNRPKVLPPDPRTEYAVVDPVRFDSNGAFVAAVNAELAKRPRGERDILFFVHGYNNTTSDAVLRLAQFVQDSDFQGVPVLFDWASAANVTRYVYDMNSALIARPQAIEIGKILDQTIAEGYDVFAHSMGSLLVMEGMVDLAQRGELDDASRLRNVILASPDIDMDLFRSQIAALDAIKDRLYVLMSEDDKALSFSRRVAGGVPRVGASNAEELAELGVFAIDLTDVDDSSSGTHSKFAGSPEVVELLGTALNNSSNFSARSRGIHLSDMLSGIPITVAF
ncbi:alpha/beta hydrolase [Pelagimonas varians]|uniref:Alpha/beta hydrolase family protein n=1 Tax=Pelagimonas varians TaxID=696760 RepID=A0A238JZN0_9RHOB|nr:alpha/beta hydrolase [Pelagimonas varians]PYG33241.1 esterase/lipase superfamily enzyme [Pelagimonas varians]SMX36099.1 hypothetical protein PEV8663_00698 [Pelagimonas varians]